MPGISKQKMAQGGGRSSRPLAEVPEGHDWSVPTDAVTLTARTLPVADQSRYGHATDAPRLP